MTSKLNIELGKKLIGCYVWSIALYGSETWKIGAEVFGKLQNIVLNENGDEKLLVDSVKDRDYRGALVNATLNLRIP